ncbi:MAG: hypothetical protein WDZ46_01125 [Solirubrobacterales bacterium]
MSNEIEAFWNALPPQVLHPLRVPILEAARWTGEPLSAVMFVDVLEGEVTMWEAIAHLEALVRLGVMRRGRRDPDAPDLREGRFDVLYRLSVQWPRDDG